MVSSRCHGQSWVVISRSSTHEQYDLFFIVLRTQWNLCWSCFPDYFVIALIILIVVALKVVLSFFFFFFFSFKIDFHTAADWNVKFGNHTSSFILFMLEECFVSYKLVMELLKAYFNNSCSNNSCGMLKLWANFIQNMKNEIRCGTNELMMDNSSPMSQMKPRYPTMDLVPWLSNSWSISPIAWEDEELA